MMNKIKLLLLIVVFNFGGSMAPNAQVSNVFSTAAIVNDDVVTNFELLQRSSMLQLFGARGDLRTLAMNQLIDERIYLQAGKELGIDPSILEVEDGMEEFASRANLTSAQLVEILRSRGVARESYFDFVRAGFIWRNVVRAKFARQASVSQNEVDTALLQSTGRGGRAATEILSYAQLTFPSSEGDAKTRAAKARVLRTTLDTCLDLRAARNDVSGSVFSEGGGTNAQIPANVAAVLANLDARETATYTTSSGQTAVLMLCTRSRELPEEQRSNITEVLTNQKVARLASGYLQELKGDAFIQIQ